MHLEPVPLASHPDQEEQILQEQHGPSVYEDAGRDQLELDRRVGRGTNRLSHIEERYLDEY